MKLYVKEKVFSWADQFAVKDATGKDKYMVQGRVFSWGKKLHVYDASGREVAYIRQELFSLLPRYDVFCGGRRVAQIKKSFTLFLPRYSIEGLNWEIIGNFWEHDYEITRFGKPVARIRKEWMTWADTYELDIADPADEIVVLAVVLTIDCVRESGSGASVSASCN